MLERTAQASKPISSPANGSTGQAPQGEKPGQPEGRAGQAADEQAGGLRRQRAIWRQLDPVFELLAGRILGQGLDHGRRREDGSPRI